MKKLFDCADFYMAARDWKMLTAMKFCLCSIGVLLGLSVPEKSKKGTIIFYSVYAALILVFVIAIAAVIIGGTAMAGGRGTLWGTLAGVMILGIVSNVLDMWGISVNLQGTVKGAVIIAAVLIQRKK